MRLKFILVAGSQVKVYQGENLTYILSAYKEDWTYDEVKVHTFSSTKVYQGELLFDSYFRITSDHISTTSTKPKDDDNLLTSLM